MDYSAVSDKVNGSEKVLIGLGENIRDYSSFFKFINSIKDKDYFIVSLSENTEDIEVLKKGLSDKDRIIFPLNGEINNEKWDDYLKWLSLTLNRQLLVMEISVSFLHPEIIRFPFEKTVFYNNKAWFIRVNEMFYQLPEELSGKADSFKMNSSDFFNELSNTL